MTKTYLKYRSRVIFISGIIFLCWIGLSIRLFKIQIIDGESLRMKGLAQGRVQEPLRPVRGNIFDRNNISLTRNIIHYSLGVHPFKIHNKQELADKISACTGRDPKEYLKKLDSNKSFVYLERNLQRSQCEDILIDQPYGIIIERDSRRYYPHENIASQILGFVNIDDLGIAGLEQKFNKYLTGTPGWVIKQMSGKGKSIFKTNFPMEPPIDGANIQLTLDLEYQAILQEELYAQVKKTEASSAMGLIINPQNGAILAMSSAPDFDPNYPGRSDLSWRRNRVISDQFEPGSTYKIVTALGALDQNTVSLWQEFNCENGSYEFAGKKIKDWGNFGLLTLPQIIENSSNVGVIKIAETLGPSKLYKYSRNFGFGTPTNISIDGENPGTLRRVNEWSHISLAEISLGHEVGVTTLQLGMAYAAIANGGFLMKPRLVNQIISSDGKIIYSEKPEVVRKISSKDVLGTMVDILCRVVETGTGTNAAINGWPVAGKTGTAQKFIGDHYSNKKFISNFAGFLPADNPQLVCVIVLDEPKIGYHWGGYGAAPVFRRVMERIINMDDSIRRFKPRTISKDPQWAQESLPLPHTQGDAVNSPVALSNQMQIMKVAQTKEGKFYMPEVRGMSLRKARTVLRKLGLHTNFTGSGKVVWQSPKPGTIVANSSICSIGLK